MYQLEMSAEIVVAVTKMAANVFGLGEVAEPECLIELLNLKLKTNVR